MTKSKTTKSGISDEHKAALAEGRRQGAIVRRYLEAINTPKRRGRPRSAEKVREEIDAVEASLPGATGVVKLELAQRRIDLNEELQRLSEVPDTSALQELEAEFVQVAAAYSARKGLSKAAWREAGVAPAVLKKAGIR